MKNRLSLLMISKNSEVYIEGSLRSIKDLADEIIVVDDGSKDKTVQIARKFTSFVFKHHEPDLGKIRDFGAKKATADWLLMLDPDEFVSKKLANEIRKIISDKSNKFAGYIIPFQNHFLGRAIHYGGENYKILRLVKRKWIVIKASLLHEKLELRRGKIARLAGKIYHYSYQSIWQMLLKFTDYSIRAARQKVVNGEKTSLKKIFIYPVHMFWARFIKDKGYRDGVFRIPLDIGFAYMEFLTYFLMLFMKKNKL